LISKHRSYLHTEIVFALQFVYFVCIPGDMLDELSAIVDGYNSYFSFSKVKSGYSGQMFCDYKLCSGSWRKWFVFWCL